MNFFKGPSGFGVVKGPPKSPPASPFGDQQVPTHRRSQTVLSKPPLLQGAPGPRNAGPTFVPSLFTQNVVQGGDGKPVQAPNTGQVTYPTYCAFPNNVQRPTPTVPAAENGHPVTVIAASGLKPTWESRRDEYLKLLDAQAGASTAPGNDPSTHYVGLVTDPQGRPPVQGTPPVQSTPPTVKAEAPAIATTAQNVAATEVDPVLVSLIAPRASEQIKQRLKANGIEQNGDDPNPCNPGFWTNHPPKIRQRGLEIINEMLAEQEGVFNALSGLNGRGAQNEILSTLGDLTAQRTGMLQFQLELTKAFIEILKSVGNLIAHAASSR